MSLLTALNLKFGFSDGVLFKDAAFQVEETKKPVSYNTYVYNDYS